jgi:adiponectin receptor
VLGTLSFVVILHPKLQGLRWRTLRLLTFVFTGLCGIAPIAHGINKFGFSQMVLQAGLPYYFAECGVFLLAAAVYGVSRSLVLDLGFWVCFSSSLANVRKDKVSRTLQARNI